MVLHQNFEIVKQVLIEQQCIKHPTLFWIILFFSFSACSVCVCVCVPVSVCMPVCVCVCVCASKFFSLYDCFYIFFHSLYLYLSLNCWDHQCFFVWCSHREESESYQAPATISWQSKPIWLITDIEQLIQVCSISVIEHMHIGLDCVVIVLNKNGLNIHRCFINTCFTISKSL